MESSTLFLDFVSLKACLKAIIHLIFKLQIFGVTLEYIQDTNLFFDNESLVKNFNLVGLVL